MGIFRVFTKPRGSRLLFILIILQKKLALRTKLVKNTVTVQNDSEKIVFFYSLFHTTLHTFKEPRW